MNPFNILNEVLLIHFHFSWLQLLPPERRFLDTEERISDAHREGFVKQVWVEAEAFRSSYLMITGKTDGNCSEGIYLLNL